MNLNAFLEQHEACEAGANWALATGCETVEEIWQRDDLKAEWRIWIATRPGVLPDSTLCKFTCRCVREVWHLLTDERSRKAVEVAEKYADGLATEKDLDAAWAAARAAVWTAARAAAKAAARAAADATADVAAWAAAWDAAWAAADAAAMAAADAVDRHAARTRQAEILREMVPTLGGLAE
jgi:hypothetical protein